MFFILLVGLVFGDPSLLWPRPTFYKMGNQTVSWGPEISIEYTKGNHRFDRAIKRYRKRLTEQRWSSIVPTFQSMLDDNKFNLKLVIQVDNVSSQEMDSQTNESYEIVVNKSFEVKLKSLTIYGAMHGLESLIQMTQWDEEKQQQFIAKVPFHIKDGPKYPHRGLLLDTSRNFYPIEDIKRTINALSMNKMNVFHWHIVDSHSWPFKSQKHPLLWQRGAYNIKEVYSFEDIKKVIRFGLDRGVRVIPELEAPGHSYAMSKAYPEIATCLGSDFSPPRIDDPNIGQINPTLPKSIEIVKDIIAEFAVLFPDSSIHISGDEVNLKCWKNNVLVKNYLDQHNTTIENVLEIFFLKMYNHTKSFNKTPIVWQEAILQNNLPLPKETLVQIWKSSNDTLKVIERGYPVLISSSDHWYLDCGRGFYKGNAPNRKSWCDPYKTWQTIYAYDFTSNLTASQANKIRGGEVAVWSEQVDPQNLDVVTWPRTSAAAEVLWSGNLDSNQQLINTSYVLSRMNNFRFYLVNYHIRAEALQPMWCVKNPHHCNAAPRN